jgi:hypothetical protein
MGRRHRTVLLCFLVLLSGAFAGIHLAWEARDGLAFPESHSERFMRYPLYCAEWMKGFSTEVVAFLSGESPLPPRFSPPGTLNYPPLTFMVSGLAIMLFGQTVSVMRLAQLLFVFGLIAVSGRIGWKLAGIRGAVLLALGITTATWTSEYTRIYTQDLGQMFFLALLLYFLLESEGLRRPWACLAVGMAFGLGMLTKYYFLLMGLPLVLVAAVPGLCSSRTSIHGGLGVLALSTQLISIVCLGMRLAEANLGRVNAEGLPLDSTFSLVLGTELLFLLGLLLACVLARRHYRNPAGDPDRPPRLPSGVGLLLVVSLAGLICAPWYFARMELWFWVLGAHVEAVPGGMHQGAWISVLARVFSNSLNVLDTFYWGGRYWLLLGCLLLWTWREKRPLARFLLPASALILGLNFVLVLPDPRYQAPLTPLLVLLAFLGLARHRVAWALGVVFMVCAGSLQMVGWLPAVERVASAVGLHLRPVSELCPHALPVAFDVSRQPLRVVPVAEPPTWSAGILDAIPAGSRVGVLLPPAIREHGGVLIREREIPVLFRTWWSHLGEVVQLGPEVEDSLPRLDYVLAMAWDSPPPPLEVGCEPELFRLVFKDLCMDRPELEVREIYFHLYACGEPTGVLGASWISGKTLENSPPHEPPADARLPEPPKGGLGERVWALAESRGRQGKLVFQSGRSFQEVRLLTVGMAELRVGGGHIVPGRVLLDGRPARVYFVVFPDPAGIPEINMIELLDWTVTIPYRWSETRRVWLAGHAEPII